MLTNAVAPDKLGGLERIVRELAAELVRRGSHVTVLAKQVNAENPRHEIGDDGVVVQRYRLAARSNPLFAPTYALYTARAVRASVRRAGSAVIHAHFPVPALPLAHRHASRMCTASTRRFIVSYCSNGTGAIRSPAPSSQLPWRVFAAPNGSSSGARRGSSSSASMRAQSWSCWIRRPPSGATLIAGGIDTRRFSPSSGGRDEWSAAAEPLLFTARRLTPRTGVLELLRAMPEIVRSLPRARLTIAGTGSSDSLLRQEVTRLGLPGSVRFVGRLSDADLVNSYRTADVVVMPSQALEGFGLTTAEALACGTPVVGTPIGATPELLGCIDSALVAADATPQGIAAAVTNLFADTELLAAIRLKLADGGTGNLSWQSVAPRYLEDAAGSPRSVDAAEASTLTAPAHRRPVHLVVAVNGMILAEIRHGLPARRDAVVVDDHPAAHGELAVQVRQRVHGRLVHIAIQADD